MTMRVDPVLENVNAVFSELDIDVTDSVKLFCCSEQISDDSGDLCTSSDGNSSTVSSCDNLQSPDIWDFNSLEVAFCDRFSSGLSVSGTCEVSYDSGKGRKASGTDVRSVNPTNEKYLDLDRESQVANTHDLHTEVFKPLYSVGCSERSDDKISSENSSVSRSSSISFITEDDPSLSHNREFDATGVWIPLLDLEREDSEWVSDKGGFNVFESGFPSPSYSQSLKSVSDPPSAQASEFETQLVNSSDHDEPLFWPFDYNSYLRPELEGNFLCISPRKNRMKVDPVVRQKESKPVRFGHHQPNNLEAHREKPQGGYRRRLMFSSESPLPVTAPRAINFNSNVMKTAESPSRFKGLTRDSCELSSNPIQRRYHQSKAANIKPISSSEDSLIMPPFTLEEASDYEIYIADETPIERMVGLTEFDGHEGITDQLDENWLYH